MYAYFEPLYKSGSYMKLDPSLFTDDEGEKAVMTQMMLQNRKIGIEYENTLLTILS